MKYWLILLLLGVAGCAIRPSIPDVPIPTMPPAPVGDASNILTSFGAWALHIGLIGITLSVLAFVASRFVPFLLGFTTLIEEVFILCVAVCLVGMAILWLGQHSWVMWVSVSGFVVLRAYDIRALWVNWITNLLKKKSP